MEGQIPDSNQQEQTLLENQYAINLFDSIHKWTKFLSILGFIFTGIIVLTGLLFKLIFDNVFSQLPVQETAFPTTGMGLIYVVVGALYFYPSFKLFGFSKSLKESIQNKSHADLISAMGNLKSFFKFWGILSIIVIALYALFFILMLIFGATA